MTGQDLTAAVTADLDAIAALLDAWSAGRLPEGGAGRIIDAAENMRAAARHGIFPLRDTDARMIAWSHVRRVAPGTPDPS